MVLFHRSEDLFKYSWDQVSKAFWCRYPNPHSKHVLTEDVLSRKIDSNGKLLTRRLLSKTTKAPRWAEKVGLVQSTVCFIIEESIVDPVNKLLTTYTKNIGMKNICLVDEKVIYKVASDVKHTSMLRYARFESNMYGLSRPIQVFALERFKSSINKAAKGFQVVLDCMYSPIVKNFDHKMISQLHPILKQKILDKTRNIAESNFQQL